jgi:hypothetical protein
MTRTVQLRRYRLFPEVVDEFLDWWASPFFATREAAGFTIEFGVFVPESNEFVWAVSAPGDRAAFEALEAAWAASPERAEIFVGRPTWNQSVQIDFVDDTHAGARDRARG